MKGGLLDVIFPHSCIGCGKFFGKKWKTNFSWWCRVCDDMVRGCTARAREIDGLCVYTIGPYECRPLAAVVHALKYRGIVQSADLCGEKIIDLWGMELFGADTIFVPIPLHRRRWCERGYNQSAPLAEALARGGCGRVDECVRRTRYTRAQAQSTAHTRTVQLKGAFECDFVDPHARYVVVDDVITTGSTMLECVAALRAAGAQDVRGVAVCG